MADDMLSLAFEYKRRQYTALIGTKKVRENTEYRVTIMNGELESMLFGNHIFFERNDGFVFKEAVTNSEIQQLQKAIIRAFTGFTHKTGSSLYEK